MKEYLPYLVSIFCSVISGFASYLAIRKQAKKDLAIISKQRYDYKPRLICSVCGKQFLYRDTASVVGKVYDPDTNEYIDVPGTKVPICDDCKRKC